MLHEEVNPLLHDYFENLLTDDKREVVAEHMKSCPDCNKEFKGLVKLFMHIKKLDFNIDPPADIKDEIQARLLQMSHDEGAKRAQAERSKLSREDALTDRSKIHREKAKKKVKVVISSDVKKKINWKKVSIIAIPVLILLYVIYNSITPSDNSPWTALETSGSFEINGTLNHDAALNEGDKIVMSGDSFASFFIESKGNLNLYSQTSVEVLKTFEEESRIHLNYGKIRFQSIEKSNNFFIDTRFGIINEFSAVFDLDVNGDEGSLKVDRNFVELINAEYWTRIPLGYKCDISEGRFSTPYHKNTTEKIKNEMIKFDFENGGYSSILVIASEATEKDAFTLWNLLIRTEKRDREYIFERLNDLFPLSKSLSKDKILQLDRSELNGWWEEIIWMFN
ncbi:MAG: zf-HC2 domain-containing protein [Melioribacteraceae bacterium]|nr:zf-HC2 domain-containing protein [Melioribacteraceae bacterium]MCF8353227.1 zf-HC2 domain-containing protein [Melioribacteraceae bacterium]MCF8393959.1 zf-HC2 domain-containing protein [Melioribacteraceae bacterium]MCF8418739.1 zf-HC2 domain-containing protein [Melioribacteraceae bacterium]